MQNIIFLETIFKEKIWGGDRLSTLFGYDIPGKHTGEAWVVSAHDNGDCIVKNGVLKGKTLSFLWQNHRELFGNIEGEAFPLLTKIIDANEDLSIQVHPDDEYAKKHENSPFGKTECWYVVDCKEDSTIIIGHNAKDKKNLKEMINEDRWDELIREVPVKKGDFFQIEPGMVHAIKAGTIILETQQNSDITYRLYDYNRLSEGKPRTLHIEKSIDVITYPSNYDTKIMDVIELDEGRVEKLISNKYYTVNKITTWNECTIKSVEAFTIINIISGKGTIDGVPIQKGDNFILTNGYDRYTFSGELTLLQSSPTQQ